MLELNPEPAIVTPDTVTLTELGFVSVTFFDKLLPTPTLPNESVDGETLRVATVGAIPVPWIEKTVGVPLALLEIVAVPFTVPAL